MSILRVPSLLMLCTTFPAAALAMPSHRVNLQAGFSMGQADYSEVPFAQERGPKRQANVLGPFASEPFGSVRQSGFHLGSTAVVHHVRLTTSLRYGAAQFSMADTESLEDGEAMYARGLTSTAYRLGLGVEAPTPEEFPTVFAELTGELRPTTVALASATGGSDYTGQAFGFAARAGAEIPFSDTAHVVCAGEVGLMGQPIWSATVGLGVHF